VSLHANQLAFTHIFSESPTELTSTAVRGSFTLLGRPRLVLYPRSGSLTADITWIRTISLDKTRSIDISISTGDNEIIHADLRLRPASAGLRLHVVKAEIQDQQHHLDRETTAGVLSLKGLLPRTNFSIRVPYNLERDLNEISIRVEVKYTTRSGEYTCISIITTPIQLPLGVNVRDVFKADR
jgi:hypothetical protein